jgi:hypothetical protein
MGRRFQSLAALGIISVAFSLVGSNAAQAAPGLTGRGAHLNRISRSHPTPRALLTAEHLRSQIAQWVDREGYEPVTMLDVVSRARHGSVRLRVVEPRGGRYMIHELETFSTPAGVGVLLPSEHKFAWVDSLTGRFTIPADQRTGFSGLDSDSLRDIHVSTR